MTTHDEAIEKVKELGKKRKIKENQLRKVENMLRSCVIRDVGYNNLLNKPLTDKELDEGKLGELNSKKVKSWFDRLVKDKENDKFSLYWSTLIHAYEQLEIEEQSILLGTRKASGRGREPDGMVFYAKNIEYWPWVKENIRGLGLEGFAKLIAETGDIRNYPNPAKLWKRLGVGVIRNISDGKLYAQGRPGNNATNEDWVMHGYNRERRSKAFIVQGNLIKQGILTDKVTGEKRVISKWGAIYMWKKADITAKFEAKGGEVLPAAEIPARHQQGEKSKPKVGSLYGIKYMSEKHRDRQASRYMLKKFLEVLWSEATGKALYKDTLPDVEWLDEEAA